MCKFIQTAIRWKLLPVKPSRTDPTKYTYDLFNWRFLIPLAGRLAAFAYYFYFTLPGIK